MARETDRRIKRMNMLIIFVSIGLVIAIMLLLLISF